MKTNQSNSANALQGKDNSKSFVVNEIKGEFNSLQHQHSGTKTFLLKVALFMVIILGVGLIKSKAQVKGVWGNPKKAHYQKFGESYVGFITGTELTPTGASALININQGSAIHTYYGMKGNASNFDLDRGSVFGLSYQPRVSFRTGNLNAGYYVSIGGEINKYNQKISPNPEREKSIDSEPIIQKQAVTEASLIMGVGAFFEVSEKWQIFVERTGRLNCDALSTPGYNMYYTSIGFRLFTLKGQK